MKQTEFLHDLIYNSLKTEKNIKNIIKLIINNYYHNYFKNIKIYFF